MGGERKMVHDTIDMNYIRHCSDYMPTVLPRPRRRRPRLMTGDGEFLPIITVECEK
jgi:hypothetical protein